MLTKNHINSPPLPPNIGGGVTWVSCHGIKSVLRFLGFAFVWTSASFPALLRTSARRQTMSVIL